MRRNRPERKHVRHPAPGETETEEWTLWDYMEEILKKVEDIEDRLKA